MTATYTATPATNMVDQVRLLLGDTDMSDPLLQDEEIQFFISTWPDPYSAAAASAEQIAAQFAREVSSSGDGVQVGTNELQDKFVALAERLRYQAVRLGRAALPYVGGQSRSDIRQALEEEDTVQTTFWTGMGDNPLNEGSGAIVDSRDLQSDQRYGGATS